MSSLQFRPFSGLSICVLVLAWACLVPAPAQETNSPLETEKKQLELERQKLELEKKQLELQRKQLQMEEAAHKELQIKETEKAVTMQLEGDVLFDFDKAEIKPEAEQTLDKVGNVIVQFPGGKVLIEGHTDSKGSPDLNLELSKRRAEAVKDWLVKKKSIPNQSSRPAASVRRNRLGVALILRPQCTVRLGNSTTFSGISTVRW